MMVIKVPLKSNPSLSLFVEHGTAQTAFFSGFLSTGLSGERVKEFYLSPNISREVPDKREAIKVKDKDKVLIVQRH